MEDIVEEPFEKVHVIPVSDIETGQHGVRLRPWNVVRRKIVPEGAREATGNRQTIGLLFAVKRLIYDLPQRCVKSLVRKRKRGRERKKARK